MQITTDKITEIFYLADEFCKEFKETIEKYLLGNLPKKKPVMTESEVISILVLFHLGSFRNMKHFYLYYVKLHLKSEFPNTVSYNRFIELTRNVCIPMSLFLKSCCMGNCTGISFVDSTPLRVCKNKRIRNNKVFKGIATVGKSTMGWFYGFKLHLIINDKGEILNFVITQANVDDREPLKNSKFVEILKGKLYADKGYISKGLADILFVNGLHIITSIRNNMKNVLMELKDKILLRKRSVIETVNDELKNMCQIEHSRHRSFTNFIANTIAALIAYSFFPKKPSIKYDAEITDQITLF